MIPHKHRMNARSEPYVDKAKEHEETTMIKISRLLVVINEKLMRSIIPLSKVIENVAQPRSTFHIIVIIRLSFFMGPLTSRTTFARSAKQMRNFLLFLSYAK